MRPAVPVLGIRLLGDLELRADGRPLPPLDSGRAESLLAYLLLNRHGPQSRERIAALLWPESAGAQARTNLRHVLHNLRRGLGASDRYLQATPRTLRWAADESCWLDVEAFESAVAAGDDRAAVDLYRGDLLANHHDEWLDSERQRLRGRLGEALYRMAENSEPTAAIGCAERLLRLDPLAEEAHPPLMRLHAR